MRVRNCFDRNHMQMALQCESIPKFENTTVIIEIIIIELLFMLWKKHLSHWLPDKKKMEKPDAQLCNNPRKAILKTVVSNILTEKGFDTVERQCLENLTEMLQSCKSRIS